MSTSTKGYVFGGMFGWSTPASDPSDPNYPQHIPVNGYDDYAYNEVLQLEHIEAFNWASDTDVHLNVGAGAFVTQPSPVVPAPTLAEEPRQARYAYLSASVGITAPSHGYTLNASWYTSPIVTISPFPITTHPKNFTTYSGKFEKFPFSMENGRATIINGELLSGAFDSNYYSGHPYYETDNWPLDENGTIYHDTLTGHQTAEHGFVVGTITQTAGSPYVTSNNKIQKFPFASDTFITSDVGSLTSQRLSHGGVSN
jgi:hypothetical protein